MSTLRDEMRPVRCWIVTVQGEPMEDAEIGSTRLFFDPAEASRCAGREKESWRRKGYPATVKVEPIMIISKHIRESKRMKELFQKAA